jgi:predicted metalloprotease with PDZ domain
MSVHRGREWRPLEDTAVAAQIAYTAQTEWVARTRGTDFYRESALLWLEADTLIRTRSGGAKSLDDFCRLFYGPPSGLPQVRPYDFDAVVTALNAVQPYDWRGFWRERLDRIRAQAPLEGLAAAGWRLSYADKPSAAEKGDDELAKWTDDRYSLGFVVLDEGATVTYLIPDSPADRAGMTPGSKLVAVNGRRYTKEVLEDALSAGGAEPRTISLLVQKDDDFRTLELTYAGKARHPRLERVSGTPDLLSVILSPISH